MYGNEAYANFVRRLKLLFDKNPDLIKTTLSNIFTMRIIGNKTHGDLAEIAISEFVNQYMYDFKSVHVGKELYRAKKHEEDIMVTDEINDIDFSISLKAYGTGPLQLSTDKQFLMFPLLKKYGKKIKAKKRISEILNKSVFKEVNKINILPLIYNEKEMKCNIMVFDYSKAIRAVAAIEYIGTGHGRKHPVYRFYNDDGNYIWEVRYGGATANALQRGLWTHTVNGKTYFDTLTNGWLDYSTNKILVELFSHSLVATDNGHKEALIRIKEDIEKQKPISE